MTSSGIAVTLHDGERTAHVMFKLICDNSGVCNISKQSSTAKVLQQCSLIVWNESTMFQKTSVEAFNRTLKVY